MRFDELNESNYLLFAIKFYDNPQAVTKDDFEDDLKRVKYIKRWLRGYKKRDELKDNVILNDVTGVINVFNDADEHLLLYNIKEKVWQCIMNFGVFLKRRQK